MKRFVHFYQKGSAAINGLPNYKEHFYKKFGEWTTKFLLIGICFVALFGFPTNPTGDIDAKSIPIRNKAPRPVSVASSVVLPIDRGEVVPKRKQVPAEVEYIDRFSSVAVAEMKKYGIPASITLAQGLVESMAGKSRLAKEANNHFGIKCFSKKCKKGHCTNHTDDSHKDFFRIYRTAWESYRHHSEFLQKDRYKACFNTTNYKDFARELQRAGYATDKQYANKLIKKINQYHLYRLDTY